MEKKEIILEFNTPTNQRWGDKIIFNNDLDKPKLRMDAEGNPYYITLSQEKKEKIYDEWRKGNLVDIIVYKQGEDY